MKIQGLPGSPGCEIAKAVVYRPQEPSYEMEKIKDPEAEISRMEASRKEYDSQLASLEEKSGEDEAIFAAYREMLMDETFFDGIRDLIRSHKVCSSYAIEQKRMETEALLMKIDDDYLRERAGDINNFCVELCRHIQGISTHGLSGVEGDKLVIFAEDLSPADTVRMDPERLCGIVTSRGGTTSHTVILARARHIPAIVGAGNFFDEVKDGDEVLIDGDAGIVYVCPDKETRKEFVDRKEYYDKQKILFDSCVNKEAVTTDGIVIRVNINSGDRESIEKCDPDTCDGCGLFRTEFVYMSHTDYPSEDEQFEDYKDMAVKLQGKELIIRTLDIGGDKQLGYMNIPVEVNPFLGYRAIRFCLDRQDIFKIQLRAILRATAYGHVKIMFPMIVNMEELREAKSILEKAKKELKQENIEFNENVPVGIMVETPAAVLLSDRLAKEVDFFSIGSNDLIQYITASDRQNEKVQNIYDSCNISFLKAVNIAAENAHKAGIEIGICGETGSEPRLIPLWVAMGINELSVSDGMVGRTKYIVSHLNRGEMNKLLDEVLAMDSIKEVRSKLDEVISEII